MGENTEKKKALEMAMSQIEKQFGKGSIMKLGENPHMEVETTSSGSLALDLALGVMGYPKGRIIEIFGPESSGKTTIALQAIAAAQRAGGKAAFIDAMNADAKHYLELVKALEEKHTHTLMEQGMPEKTARAKASKMANEDARFVLPNACETKMVMTMNCRSLNNFFNLRCCNRAQWEIRELAYKMLEQAKEAAPLLFKNAGASCVATGHCPEGAMTCGRFGEMIKMRTE